MYVAPSQIRRFNLKTGDIIVGNRRVKSATEKFAALFYIKTVNGYPLSATETRPNFEDLTPIFPNRRLHMETPGEEEYGGHALSWTFWHLLERDSVV